MPRKKTTDYDNTSITTLKGADRVLLNEEERRFLEPPKADELYKAI